MKSQDVVILAKLMLLTPKQEPWPYGKLAESLVMSASEVHAGVKRLVESRLISPKPFQLYVGACQDFLFHGLPYVFPVQPGAIARGIPTSHSTPPLADKIVAGNAFVWPCAKGTLRGESIEPLYRSVPEAVEHDSNLHQILALFDALRLGRSREKALAEQFLIKGYLNGHG